MPLIGKLLNRFAAVLFLQQVVFDSILLFYCKRLHYEQSAFQRAPRAHFLFVCVQRWAPWGGLQKSKLVFSSHVFLIKVLLFAFAFALNGGMLNAKGEVL